MHVIEFTVRACIHLVRMHSHTYMPDSIGSGVIISYKGRFFLCTVEHFTNRENMSIGIVTGNIKNGETENYVLGDFSYFTLFSFEETPDSEDLLYTIENPDRSGEKLDLAIRELDYFDIKQDQKIFDLKDVGKIEVHRGLKINPIVDDFYEIDENEQCSFFGRIKPNFDGQILDFGEMLYWALPIRVFSEDFIEMDLGEPIRDYTRFKGCSGAPIVDTRGRVIALVTHGSKDINDSKVYGFRFDKVKRFIDLMYFTDTVN